MKATSRKFIRTLTHLRIVIIDEFESYIYRMQPYEVSAFYLDIDSSYKFYSEKYFDEDQFKQTILMVYSVNLDDPVVKEEVQETIHKYSRALIYLKAVIDFIKVNEIDLGDTE
jgi:hypothetical protein